jgi:hypothetical protein
MRFTLFETFIGVGRIDPAGACTVPSSLTLEPLFRPRLQIGFLVYCDISPCPRYVVGSDRLGGTYLVFFAAGLVLMRLMLFARFVFRTSVRKVVHAPDVVDKLFKSRLKTG